MQQSYVAQQAAEKLFRVIEHIREHYHTAPLDGVVSGQAFPTNPLLMAESYLLKKKHALVGEPGFGKTTVAKIIATLFSQIPYDVYDACAIEGHPETSQEKMIARPDFGALSQGRERVIWNARLALSCIVIDEFNRLPPSKQELLLQGIETGTWNYLSQTYMTGRVPGFVTMNHQDNGNNHVIPPLMDRIHVVTEEAWESSFVTDDIARMYDAKQALCHPQLATDFFKAAEKDVPDADLVARTRNTYRAHLMKQNVPFLTDAEQDALRIAFKAQPISLDARLFWQCVDAECNLSQQYGVKRSNDPTSQHSHDTSHISTKIKNAVSPRALGEAVLPYAQALSYLLGEKEVSIATLRFIIPYALAHRCVYTDDYRAAHAQEERQDMEQMHLAKGLAELAFANFTKSIEPIKQLIHRIIQKDPAAREEAREAGATFGTHPFLRDIQRQLARPEKPFYEK